MSDCMTQEDAMNMNNEQAIQILTPFCDMLRDQNGFPISDAYFALEKAIKALQEQKVGKWLIEIEEEHTEKYDARIPHWFCSCCRTEYDPYSATLINYCSTCGARMEVDDG